VSDYDCSMGSCKFTVDIEDLKDEYNYLSQRTFLTLMPSVNYTFNFR